MFRNYLLVALRTLFSNKLFSAINILGLAIGLACVVMISLFVSHETGYDRQWANADRSYRVMRTFTPGSGTPDLHLATNAPQVGPLLQADYPELEQVVRLNNNRLILSRPESDEAYYENNIYFADPEVSQVFDIPLISGSWEGALQAPFQLVLNESLARKYFGTVDIVGQSITVNDLVEARISAVMEDVAHSHIAPSALASISTLTAMFGEAYLNDWGSNNYHTYIVTPPDYDIDRFTAEELPAFLRRHLGENVNDLTYFSTMPVTDIHLKSNRDNELAANGSQTVVYTFSAIALLILLIACFNFMNLSTARSMVRAREVGMRKILGGSRGQLVIQFLGESVLLATFAVIAAVGLVELLLPWFNSLLDLNLSLDVADNPRRLGYLFALIMVVGLLAGSYPAFYLAGYPIVQVLKGELTRGSRGEFIRKTLVVAQFAISIVLIIASGIALAQLRYAATLDKGLDSEQVLIYSGNGTAGLGDSYEAMKQELLRHPEVVSVTAANLMPSDQNTNSTGVRFESEVPEVIGMAYLNVDYDFFENFDIDFLAGRAFDLTRGTDMFVEPDAENSNTTAAYILNESAARQLGWTPREALGKWFEVNLAGGERRARGDVIGVAQDVYFSSIREAVKPLFYRLMPHDNPQSSFANLQRMAVKVSGNNLQETVDFINRTWQRFNPTLPVQQSFLEQNYAALYDAERRQGNIFTIFSIIAVFIAGMGLFGLAAYMTERRTREIGIRKVLGSTVLGIVKLLSLDFCRLVVIANLIAWPAAWYFMQSWLANFAYQVEISPVIFVLAAALALVVAVATVGSLAAVTASRNPVLALRHE